jgi:glycosyltransferase involved in cell wall biosynthesis
MRVAAYTHLHRTRNPTGAGQYLIQMVHGLWQTPGVEVTVVAPRRQLDEAGRIPSQNPLAGIPARGMPLDRRWLEAMWEFVNVPKVDRWCEGADWVYTPTEAYIAVRRPRLAVTVHDLHAFETDLPWSDTPEHRAFRRRWRRMLGPIVKRADCIITGSEFTRRRLVDLLGASPERIAIVANGALSEYFDSPVTGEAGGLGGARYVAVVGGLSRRKGGDLVLRAAEILQREMPDLRVLVAGEGEPALDAPASELPNVTRLGFVALSRMVEFLRGAVALLFLSRYEGFGMPVVEAMAAGTPVIASRWAALPETVGDAGLLVDADNPGEVVAAIRSLVADSGARAELCALGRKRAEGYRWERCVERLAAVLREW